MADIVSVDELSDAIIEAINEYTDDVSHAIPKVIDRNTKAALEDLRARSPRRQVGGGEYAAGWVSKKAYSRTGFEGRVIYNKTRYQLTHLLEHGHATRNGGHTRLFPHIAPVAEAHGAKLLEELKLVIRSGGAK